MNSFIQTLYMIHDFRNAIFKMPLWVGDPLTPSGFLEGQKYQILYSIQKLFVQMKAGAKIAESTKELTDSFGWKDNQQMVQHDVQELIREFLSVLERALKGTSFETLISDLFSGIKSDILQVPEHGIWRARDEHFADIIVQVRCCGDLEASLSNYFNFEFLTGDNQYYCEEVDAKVDALKGVQIRKFPKILTISLLRFDFDFEKMTLAKLNEKFKFPLELHLNQYLTDDSDQKGEDIDYELLSCIIHIGNVGGGHYKAYIRDYANEGTWDFDLYDREEEKKENKKDQGVGTSDDAEDKKDESKEDDKIDYNGDFPLPYKNPELGKNWYEFNDSFVRPIVAGRLESQFGNGSSNQNAYILIYKRKNDKDVVEYENIPDYWVDEIMKQNEASKTERLAYDFEANHLEIYLQPQAIFEIQEGVQLKYIDLKDTEEQGVKIKFTFDNTVSELKAKIRESLSLGSDSVFDAFEVCKLNNDLCQVFRSISEFDDEIIIKQSQVTHLSTWMITTDQNIISYMNSIKGIEFEPIYINYRFNEIESRVIMYKNMTCGDFIQKTAEVFGYDSWKKVKCTYFVDGVMRRLDRLKYDVEKQRDHTLKSLNLKDWAQVVVEEKSEEEIKIEEQNKNMQADFIDPNSSSAPTTTETYINVDETENIRSVLMHKEEDPEFLERFNVDLNWTISELTEKLKQYMGIKQDEERRLRREFDNSLIVKEELSIKLFDYPEFREGGVRLKMEYGRFPSVEELALSVALYNEKKLRLRFYLKKESTILEGKEKICKEFGVDPHKYRLWRTDFEEEPQYIG